MPQTRGPCLVSPKGDLAATPPEGDDEGCGACAPKGEVDLCGPVEAKLPNGDFCAADGNAPKAGSVLRPVLPLAVPDDEADFDGAKDLSNGEPPTAGEAEVLKELDELDNLANGDTGLALKGDTPEPALPLTGADEGAPPNGGAPLVPEAAANGEAPETPNGDPAGPLEANGLSACNALSVCKKPRRPITSQARSPGTGKSLKCTDYGCPSTFSCTHTNPNC